MEFQHEQNLIPADSHPSSMAAAQSEMKSYVGYNPNFSGKWLP